MTHAGEWDNPPFSAYHWAQFVDGYLDAVATGATPHLVSPLGDWLATDKKSSITITSPAGLGYFHLNREESGRHFGGIGILLGEHVVASWNELNLDQTVGVIVFARAGSGLIRAVWAYSSIAGDGALTASPKAPTSGFEGTYSASFIDGNGVTKDTGIITVSKSGDSFSFDWVGAVGFTGIGLEVTNLLGADDNGQWLAVAFTQKEAKSNLTLADYEYTLDRFKGNVVSTDSRTVVVESLTRSLKPLDY